MKEIPWNVAPSHDLDPIPDKATRDRWRHALHRHDWGPIYDQRIAAGDTPEQALDAAMQAVGARPHEEPRASR